MSSYKNDQFYNNNNATNITMNDNTNITPKRKTSVNRTMSVDQQNNNANGEQQQQGIDMVSLLSAPPPPTVRIYDPMQKHQPQQNKFFFHLANNSINQSNISTSSSSNNLNNLNNSTSSLPNSNGILNNDDQQSSSSGANTGIQSTNSPLKSSASSSSFNRLLSDSEKPQHIVDQELLKKILNEDDDDIDMENVNIDLNDILKEEQDDDDLMLEEDIELMVDNAGISTTNSSIGGDNHDQQNQIQGSPLTLAEERERLLSLANAPLPMLWKSKNARKSYNGIVVEPQFYTKISEQLSSVEIRKETGFPTCFCTAKYICIGTSHGYILIFNYHQELLSIIGGAICADSGSVTAIDLPSCKVNEDWMVSGHQNGQVILWDVQSGKPLKILDSKYHKHPILHLKFFADGHRFISSDAHGVTNIFTIQRGLMSFNIDQQLLLNGNLGPVLSIALLLPGNYPHPTDRSYVIALATKRKILIISASVEGVSILNNKISKPQHAKSSGVLPYLSWRRVCYSKALGHTKPLEPILAIGWGSSIQLLQIVTHPNDLKFQNPEFIIVAEYQTDNDICGLEWIDSQTILLLNSKDELRIFDPFALEEVESVNIKSMQLIHHSKFQNVYSFHNTIRTLKSHMYLLGMNGFFSAHILTWLERLSILVSHHQWFEALCLSLDFYEGKAKATTGLSSNTVDSKVITSDKTIEILSQLCHLVFTSEAEQIREHSLIPKSMFDETLMDASIQRLNIYQQLALIAIEFCIDVKRTDFLFGEVFNYYVEASMVGIFLEFLEPYILRDRLSNLNPEVMQYMMSHYQERHVLSRAEQCLLHLDIASLDFHQTVILCRKHGLYSAIIYLYNKGLDDYITPLEDMMEVLIKPNNNNNSNGQEDNSEIVRTSPSSRSPSRSTEFNEESREVAYRLLLYLQYSLSGRSFPTGTIAPSRVPSLKMQVLEYLFLRNIFPEDPTPYPRLYSLIKFDSTETLKILLMTFDDEFLSNHDLNNILTIPPIPFNVTSSNLNHHTMFSVLLLIMIDRSQQPYDIKDNDQWAFSLQQQGQLFVLLANCYKSKLFQRIDNVLMNRMIGLLAAAPLTNTPMFSSPERQTALLSIITTLPIDAFDYERLLVLCEGNEFYRVSQYLYSLQSNYSKMISCQVRDPQTKMESFNYIRDLLSQDLTEEARVIIKNTTISTLAQLIIIDSTQTAQLIMDHFSADHEKILKELSSFPKLQYTYLVGLLGTNDANSNRTGTFSQKTGIIISNETYELYIKLMCIFSPQSVYKYLSSHDDYPLDACLKICQQYNNFEGATYLLERTGDVPRALDMILITLKNKIEELLKHFSTVFANVKNLKNDKPSPQEKEVMDILNSAIALCQRNSAKLQSSENQMIWFKLLDTIVLFVRKTKQSLYNEANNQVDVNGINNNNNNNNNQRNKPKTAVYVKSTTFLNKLVHYILNSMMGYVALHYILTKIVNDHGSDEFGDFKTIISGMLDTCTFETSILNTANQLIQRDMYTTTAEYIESRARAYSPAATRCLMCNRPLKEFNGQVHTTTPADSVIVFQCGHSLHSSCLGKHTACPHCSSSKTKTKRKATISTNEDDIPENIPVDPKKQIAQDKENDQKSQMVYLERLNNYSKVSKRASMYNFDTTPIRNGPKKGSEDFRDAEGYQFQNRRGSKPQQRRVYE